MNLAGTKHAAAPLESRALTGEAAAPSNADQRQVRQLQVAVAELRSLKQGRRVYYRSGSVFLLSNRDDQLKVATDSIQQLLTTTTTTTTTATAAAASGAKPQKQ